MHGNDTFERKEQDTVQLFHVTFCVKWLIMFRCCSFHGCWQWWWVLWHLSDILKLMLMPLIMKRKF